MTDWRALCAALADNLDAETGYTNSDGKRIIHPGVARARAALAQQEPEGPTDEELLSLDQLRDAWNAHADAANGWDELGVDEIVWWAQRQALAGWGRLTPQPADGEVAKLVAELKGYVEDGTPLRLVPSVVSRAADLLERLSPPQPVPVSERLPAPEDCDAEGRCWLCGKAEGDWRLLNPEKSGVPQLKYVFSHWLPAHALPVPTTEAADD